MGCFMMTAETQKEFTKADMSEYMIDEESEDVINMNDKKDIQFITNIENKYGLVLFRMGLSHLVDMGHRNLTDENVEESIRQIMAQGEEDKTNGKIPIMTPEFLCEVLRCAAELSKFGIWTLFAYINEHVVVGTEANKYLLLNCFEREICLPETYDSLEEAQSAMKAALIEAMDGVDDRIFSDYTEDEEYALESNAAWFNHRHGNSDWIILTQTSAGRIQYA